MRVLRRLLALLSVIVVLALLVLIAAPVVITARALPQVGGTLRIAGLHGQVTVVRDAAGVAQIYADDPHDLFLAQGYVHAQDRMWQMEVWRHIASGRLAELFGASEVPTDRFIRTLGWRQAAENDLAAASPELRDDLAAYADGVNAYLGGHRDALGLAFVVTGLKSGLGGIGGYQPEPWTPVDSAAWEKVQAFNLGGNFADEIFRMSADAKLGDPAMTNELTPAYAAGMPVIDPTGAPLGSAAAATAGITAGASRGAAPSPAAGTAATGPRVAGASSPPGADLAAWRTVAGLGSHLLALAGLDAAGGLAGDRGIGSNDWVVAPSKSATGHALLANDPHLGISMPSVWYMNGLHCRKVDAACPFDVVGVSFPGSPLVILGHNARIAWGATNVGPDVQDLFIEKVDPADPAKYLFKGASLSFTTRTETIKVAGGEPVTFTVRSTGHGPIINDVEDRLKGSATLYALQWTATAAPDTTLQSFLDLDKAVDYTTFRAALASYVAPSQNFVYADVDGHIGYQVPGWIPIRQDPADQGQRPVPGWDGQHEWTGRIAYDDLPRLFDPPSGVIVTANNAVVNKAYPYFIARDWDPGYRAKRITQLLSAFAASGGVTTDEMRGIEMDTTILRAPLVTAHLAGATPATADGQAVLDAVRAWDGTCPTDSTGCAAYMTFEYRLLRGLFDPRLGDLARDYVGSEVSWQALIALLDKPTDRWWDDPATPAVETSRDGIAAALDNAGRDLRSALGQSSEWTWGRLHTATFREQTLGTSGIGPLEWYFDQGPQPVAGAAGAVLNTYYRFSSAYADPFDPSVRPATDVRQIFEVTNLPSYRLTIDMGALDEARIIQTTGQSGNPFDRHYGDLIGPWLRGDTVPLPFGFNAVEKAAVTTLTLMP